MFKRSIPFYYIVLSCMICCAGTAFVITAFVYPHPSSPRTVQASSPQSTTPVCIVDEPRLNGYNFIKPLLSAEPECEAEKYMPIKSAISDQISILKSAGIITTASVYVRDFDHGDWISVNDDEKYLPGSLMKVPTMIAMMRMAEENPKILDKVVTLDKPYTNKIVSFKSKTLEAGHNYSIREALRYMIEYSDNNASSLIAKNIDVTTFQKTFVDLGLPAVNVETAINHYTARELSVFLKILYNASYLNINNSEYATELLTKSDFDQGIAAGLPPSTKIAHKFGEAGDNSGLQLHETAIVYMGKSAYEITILCKGTVLDRMPQALSSISKVVYDKMSVLQKAA